MMAQIPQRLRSVKVVGLPAAALLGQVNLAHVKPFATIHLCALSKFSIAIVVVMAYLIKGTFSGVFNELWNGKAFPTYRGQERGFALHQQRAQLGPAQTLQAVLPQQGLIAFRVQLMGEVTNPSAMKQTHESKSSHHQFKEKTYSHGKKNTDESAEQVFGGQKIHHKQLSHEKREGLPVIFLY